MIYKPHTDLERCNQEIEQLKQEAQNGNPDVHGIMLGLHDWRTERELVYDQFLRDKAATSKCLGFEIEDAEVHPILKPHQRVGVRWAVRGGRRALFEAFGLGKTVQQLEILRLILARAGGRGLIVAPKGVRQEFHHDAKMLGLEIPYIRRIEECGPTGGLYLTNYEPVRDGKLDPSAFTVTSLDEASILRGFGGTKTFREFMRLFENVQYRFVATATPDPNEYIELLAYAAYLGIMDVSQAKTRFFKRNATQADNLTIAPGKEEEFWLWVASWALFLQRPSDLGFDDEGYALPEMQVIHHEIRADARDLAPDRDGQYRMVRDGSLGVTDSAREKRDSLGERIQAVGEILAGNPTEHHILWHDLEDERRALERLPRVLSVYGSQDDEEQEERIESFTNGEIYNLAAKPQMFGYGCNWQKHCHIAIFTGIGLKFAQFIQAIHRVYRFLQTQPVEIHLVYTDNERPVLQILMEKWERHKEKVKRMSEITKEYGLSELALAQALTRTIGVERVEATGEHYTLVNNDSVKELWKMETNSAGLILTSIPFSTQYEYTPCFNDFGHTENNGHFFEQMDFLTPELLRVLQPGRVAAIHVKDRVIPGGMTGLGFQTVYPFHADCIAHFTRHGFAYMGMKTVVTDVVRENNQTYRLGWTEQCKDATKMSCGIPEYLLLFRKPQTDTTKSYADTPVVKSKQRYSKARWQVDAHAFSRSAGNRLLTPEEVQNLPHASIFKLFDQFFLKNVYDFEYHVKLGDALEKKGRLPVTFMLLQPPSWHPDVWTDITRMLTLNAAQSAKGRQMHLCPMQLDLADRVIAQMSNPGELVLDPFSGLGTVPSRAVALGRRGLGIELNPGYFADACMYCEAAEKKLAMPGLFDALEAGTDK